MNSLKRIVGTSILSLARFLDAYFYYIVTIFAGLAAFNYFFVKNYDKELFEAAKDGNIKRLKEALRNDADVNSMHMGECTALMMACGMKHEEVARVLVETEKCKIDTVDAKGRSALLIASGAGLVDSVKLLLKNKADVKLSDNNGSTPLIVACCEYRYSIGSLCKL
jgi:ankyrin repeat protein